MAHKPNVENRWWVETTVKRPRQTRPEAAQPAEEQTIEHAPDSELVARFYSVARGYEQERAKEDLTDNNLRIARAANPQPGQWVYVPMTEEHYPERLIKRVKDEFRLPREARGVLLDHGRLVRLLICGPQLEDWMIDVTLGEEPSVDVYVWNTMQRERLFRRAEEALRQARRWALSLLQHPPQRDDPFRGALL
ncbi:MAG TPA: hypothetical protein VFB33_11085 [Candidatus Binataceae bacterium]|jgi:hypothetical protein|nr:hypothetical protein [Candidatus Binataceae bacterium]